MKLVTLENEMPVFEPEIRTITEFNRILMRDKDRTKKFALKELAFVYFYCVFDSRFDYYSVEKERNDAIKRAVGLEDDWEKDSIINDAINCYTDLMQTESMRLVNKARAAIKKFEEYLEEVDLTERIKDDGGLLHNAKQYRENVNGIAEMIQNLNKAKDIVHKEIEDKFGKKQKLRSLAEESFTQLEDNLRI